MIDRSVMRAAAVAAMLGAVLAIVFNVLHPRGDEISAEEAVRLAGEGGIWLFDHFVLALTIPLALFALVVISRTFAAEPAASWGRIARPFAIAAAVIAFTTLTIDGWVLAEAADEVGGDVALTVAYLSEGLFLATVGAFFGFTPLLYGIAVLSGDDYPPWLGWVAVLAGLVGIATFAVVYFAGLSPAVVLPFFLISSILFTVWIGLMGWQLWQKAAAPAPTAARTSV